jgi:hypothetical protein
LPDGWPDWITQYPGSTAKGGIELNTGSIGYCARFTTKDSLDEVMNYYEELTAAQGWKSGNGHPTAKYHKTEYFTNADDSHELYVEIAAGVDLIHGEAVNSKNVNMFFLMYTTEKPRN